MDLHDRGTIEAAEPAVSAPFGNRLDSVRLDSARRLPVLALVLGGGSVDAAPAIERFVRRSGTATRPGYTVLSLRAACARLHPGDPTRYPAATWAQAARDTRVRAAALLDAGSSAVIDVCDSPPGLRAGFPAVAHTRGLCAIAVVVAPPAPSRTDLRYSAVGRDQLTELIGEPWNLVLVDPA